MSGGEKFSALGARELLLIVVFCRDMLQQRLLSLEFFGTVGTGKCFAFKMQLEVSLHIAFGCEHFATLHTSVLSLDFGMSLHVLLVKITVLEFSAAHFALKDGHLVLLALYHRLSQDIQLGLGSGSLLILYFIRKKLERHFGVNNCLSVDTR